MANPGKWKKGESGNPKGPIKLHKITEVRRLAKSYSPRMMHRLAEIAESEDLRAAVVACNSILDRAYGRPSQAIQVSQGGDKEDQERARHALAQLLATQLGLQTLDTIAKALPVAGSQEVRHLTVNQDSAGSTPAPQASVIDVEPEPSE